MSPKRISNTRRRTRRRIEAALPDGWPARLNGPNLKVHHFAGISLAGGKTDKTCLALVEYYPAQKKIFLSRLFEKIRTEGEVSADLQLHRLLATAPGKLESVGFDVPLRLPKCVRCRKLCPGFEACTEPEIEWMWSHYRKINAKRKPKRLFTPYTERCVETYLGTELEEAFHPSHALGANMAPLTARALFVARRLKLPLYEVFPKLSVWRIGRSLHVARSHLMFHKHAVGGDESRRIFLTRLRENNLAFLYEQDVQAMVENNQAFEAFVTALTGVLNFRGDCEPRPKDFPKSEAWIAIPRADVKL